QGLVHLVGGGAGDGEAVLEVAGEEEERGSGRHEEGEPDRDDGSGAARRGAPEPVEKFSHGPPANVGGVGSACAQDVPASGRWAPYPARVAEIMRSRRSSQTRRDSAVSTPPVASSQYRTTTRPPLTSELHIRSTVKGSAPGWWRRAIAAIRALRSVKARSNSTASPGPGAPAPPGSPREQVSRTIGVTRSVLRRDRKSTRLNSSHVKISYAVF